MLPRRLLNKHDTRGSCSTGSPGPSARRRRCRRRPASFFFCFLRFGSRVAALFGPCQELGLYSLRQPLFFFSRLATSTGELYAQPAHGTTDRLRQTSASQAFGLLASVSQYASSAWLPNLEEVLAAACCGARFRCKRSLWPSTHADQLGLQVAVSGGLRQQSRSKQLSGPSFARRSERSA